MGNYNCQECINKEVNIINELLLDNNFFSNDSIEQESPSKSHFSRLKNLQASKEDLRKAIEKTNLSEEQKIIVHKMINENSIDFDESKGNSNTIKLRVGQRNITDENYNENKMSQEEQNKLIQEQKEQILRQNKIIEDQQLQLEEQHNILKKEEEKLKKQIQQAQGQKKQEQEEQQQENIEGIKIKTLEPPKAENENVENIVTNFENKKNNEQIVISQEQEKNEIKQEQIKESPEKNTMRQNIHPKDVQSEKKENQQMENNEEQSLNINQQQKRILDNYAYFKNQVQIQQQFNENIRLMQGLPQQPQSQRFKIETYEPIEPGSKNSNDNDNNFDEINENDENDFNNDTYPKMEIKRNEPRDSKKPQLTRPVGKKAELDINNMNNYKNWVQEKVNFGQKSPKDNSKSNIENQFKGTFKDENEMNMNMQMEVNNNTNKRTGPRDSKRKNFDQKLNLKENKNYFSHNEPLKQKKKPYNRNEKSNEMAYESEQIKIKQKNNLITNPIAGAISNAVLNQNNYIQQQQQQIEGPYSQSQFHFVKKEILNPTNQDYFIQQQINSNDIINTQQYYSPRFNEMNNGTLNNEINNVVNYDNEVNIIASGSQFNEKVVDLEPQSNQIVEINTNSSGKIFSPKGYEEQQYDYPEYQQTSQKEFDITLSDRDNPLIYSDDKGNMNFLERQYAVYQDRINGNNDY